MLDLINDFSSCLIENFFLLSSIDLYIDIKSKVCKYIFIIVLSILSIILNTENNALSLVIPILFILFYIYVNNLSFKRSDFIKGIFIFLFNLLISLFVILSLDYFLFIKIYEFSGNIKYTILIFLIKYFMYLILKCFKNFTVRSKLNFLSVKIEKENLFFSLVVFFFLTFYVTLYYLNILDSKSILIFLFINLIYILFILYLNYKLSDLEVKSEEAIVNKIMNDNMKEIISNINDIQALSESNKHDYKNHLIALKYLIETEQKEKMNEYINKLLDITNILFIHDTGNTFLDYLLTAKHIEMKKRNISFYSDISTNLIDIDLFSINVIFGNLFDNAIESQELICDINKRKIFLKISQDSTGVKLVISNTVLKKVEIINKQIKTTKANKEGEKHGIGLKNVYSILDNLNSIYDISCDDNNFVFKIIFLGKDNR